MRPFRFHIGSLVLLVLLLGVGFVALRESNNLWDSSIFSLTLVVILISFLLGIHRTEKRGAFWLGFALFGSAYLALSLIPSIESRLLTTRALTYLDSKVPRSNAVALYDVNIVNNSQQSAVHLDALYLDKRIGGWIKDLTTAGLVGPVGTTENFVRIGHSLLALIAAFLGGQLSRHLFSKNREPVYA